MSKRDRLETVSMRVCVFCVYMCARARMRVRRALMGGRGWVIRKKEETSENHRRNVRDVERKTGKVRERDREDAERARKRDVIY